MDKHGYPHNMWFVLPVSGRLHCRRLDYTRVTWTCLLVTRTKHELRVRSTEYECSTTRQRAYTYQEGTEPPF